VLIKEYYDSGVGFIALEKKTVAFVLWLS